MRIADQARPDNAVHTTTIGKAFKVVGGGTPSTTVAEYWNGDIPWITSADIDDQLRVTPRKKITRKAIENSATNFVPAGSVIVVTRVGLGKVAVAPCDLCFSQDCQALIIDQAEHDPKYIALQLKGSVGIFKHIGRGTTINGVTKKQLLDLAISLPPLPEQHWIVEEIEKQFTRLDAGESALKRMQANLKRYRASVLKTACEGRLVPTEAELARKEGRSFEHAEVLLRRILEERSKRVARTSYRGKTRLKDTSTDPLPSNTIMPKLPEGWTYATVEQLGIIGEQVVLTGPFGTNLGRKDFINSGVPLLTIACLRDKGINLDKAEFVSEDKANELERYRLSTGDLLFSRMASVGRAGIVGESLSGVIFNYHIMRLRLEPSVLNAKYYLAYVRGSEQVERFIRDVNHGATRDGINTAQLLKMPVSLPPFAEQHRIIAEIERRLSVIDELETAVAANLKRTERLRQSILNKAFTGQLV